MNVVLLGCADRRISLHWRTSLGMGYQIKLASNLNSVLDQCTSNRDLALIIIHYELLSDHYEEELSRLQRSISEFKILLIGRKCSREIQLKAFSRGIVGYMEAQLPKELLRKGVDRLLQGEVWVDRQMVTSLLETLRKQYPKNDDVFIPRNLVSLTPREIEIAQRVCQGESNKKIANHLDITERTVKAHLSSIFRKLDVTDRLQLALRLRDSFLENQLITADGEDSAD